MPSSISGQAFSRARPIRIAYFVHADGDGNRELDGVFTFAAGLWAGRFSLIVPCHDHVPDEAYLEWLAAFDADVLYSFVDFPDAVVRRLHEFLYPSVLVKHIVTSRDDIYGFRPDLHLLPLSSLTMVPLAAGLQLGAVRQTIGLTDCVDPALASGFLRDTFGSTTECLARSLPSSYSSFAHKVRLAAPRGIGADQAPRSSEIVPTLTALVQRLANEPRTTGPVQLSAHQAPRLVLRHQHWSESLNLVVGDTFEDRLMYWNTRMMMPGERIVDLVCARVPSAEAADAEFLDALRNLLRSRNHNYSDHTSGPRVTLRSTSIPADRLEEIAAALRGSILPLNIDTQFIANQSDWMPNALHFKESYFQGDSFWHESPKPHWTETAYVDDALRLNPPYPPFLAGLPEALRETTRGVWAVDVDLDRSVDHSPYSNVRHRWTLPRRLRILGSMLSSYQLGDSYSGQAHPRVSRNGLLTLFATAVTRLPILLIPDDEATITYALTQGNDWSAFDRAAERNPLGPPQLYYHARPSSHGRYFRAAYRFFGSINEARGTLMHRFWRDRFAEMGATSRKNEALRERVGNRLNNRFRDGQIRLADAAQLGRLTDVVLQEAATLGKAEYDIKWDHLRECFLKLQQKDEQANPFVQGADIESWRRDQYEHFVRSVQELCRREVLYQGLRHRCPTCLNQNWISIDALGRMIKCPVCGHEEPAPIEHNWQFRLNGFFTSALREYGAWPVFWTLCAMQRQHPGEESFFFAGPLELFLDQATYERGDPSAEVDLIIVKGGKVSVVEAKQSTRKLDIDKFIAIVKHLRPDRAVLAIMEPLNQQIERHFRTLEDGLRETGIEAALLPFNEDEDWETDAWP